jgi:hypothetical protein
MYAGCRAWAGEGESCASGESSDGNGGEEQNEGKACEASKGGGQEAQANVADLGVPVVEPFRSKYNYHIWMGARLHTHV